MVWLSEEEIFYLIKYNVGREFHILGSSGFW